MAPSVLAGACTSDAETAGWVEAAALLIWARSASETTPFSFKMFSSCGTPVEAGTLVRVLASADVRTPFMTKSPNNAGLSAASPSALVVTLVKDVLLGVALPSVGFPSPAHRGTVSATVSKARNSRLNESCIDPP